MRSILVSVMMVVNIALFAQQDSILVQLTNFQKLKFEAIKEKEKQLMEQYRDAMQLINKEKNDLIILIADFNNIKIEEIVGVDPKENEIIFKLKK